jgi:hypothetical protein
VPICLGTACTDGHAECQGDCYKVPDSVPFTASRIGDGICDPYLNCEERQFDRGDCVVLAEGDACNQISDMCSDGLFCDVVGQTLTCVDTDGCSGVDCGTGAMCSDATAPSTGYTCACGSGFTGSDTVDAAATCVDTTGCTDVANADAATLTCTSATDSQVTACQAGFNLCESGGTEACADGTQPDASADACVPNPTCGNVDDDDDGGSEPDDAFACADGYDLQQEPNTITCAAAACTADDCCC